MDLTILVIRHGEKPQKADDSLGLLPDGTPDARSLTVRGWQRAGAWATLFGAASGPVYPTPGLIVAPATDRGPDAKLPSRRPLQTVTPLAERLGLEVRSSWAQGEEADVAAEVRAASGVVLIAWEHKRITSALLPALMGPAVTGPDVPTRWDSSRFDVVLRLDRATPTSPLACSQLFPLLLSGDSTVPLR